MAGRLSLFALASRCHFSLLAGRLSLAVAGRCCWCLLAVSSRWPLLLAGRFFLLAASSCWPLLLAGCFFSLVAGHCCWWLSLSLLAVSSRCSLACCCWWLLLLAGEQRTSARGRDPVDTLIPIQNVDLLLRFRDLGQDEFLGSIAGAGDMY